MLFKSTPTENAQSEGEYWKKIKSKNLHSPLVPQGGDFPSALLSKIQYPLCMYNFDIEEIESIGKKIFIRKQQLWSKRLEKIFFTNYWAFWMQDQS